MKQKEKNKEPAILKHLSIDAKSNMDSMDPNQLKNLIVSCEISSEELKKELESNEQYQSAMSVKKDIEAGQREVKNVLKAKIKYSLMLLEQKGLNNANT